jgi:aminoglycoside 6'-N-acetyltransferase
MEVLRGERVVLRPAQPEDAEALVAIVILAEDEIAGWLLCDEEKHPDYESVAFDILVTTRLHGQGYGPEALRVAIRHFVARGHHRFTIDPTIGNDQAIRAYEKVGFKPVGVLRQYARLDGRWHDALFMDLLAEELSE